MKGVIALAAVILMLGTELPGVAQARVGGPAGTNTKTTAPKAKPKPKPKPKEKPKAKAKATVKPATKPVAKPAAAPTASASAMTGTPSVTAATPTIPPVRSQSLEARLQPLLPPGMNATDASKGFKNWGRFVAAVHASRNLNIPFQTLKLKMTGDMPLSLGQAIQAIRTGAPRPTAVLTQDRTATTASAVTQAEQQAAEDFRNVRD